MSAINDQTTPMNLTAGAFTRLFISLAAVRAPQAPRPRAQNPGPAGAKSAELAVGRARPSQQHWLYQPKRKRSRHAHPNRRGSK